MHMHSSVLIPSIQICLPNKYPKIITTCSEMQTNCQNNRKRQSQVNNQFNLVKVSRRSMASEERRRF
jgi:hypothetical protein